MSNAATPLAIEAFAMNVWHNLHQYALAAGHSRSGDSPVPMRQSRPIEVDGVFLGAAVEHELGVRFIAVDVRVTEMDQSIWPSLDYAYRSARQLFKSGRAANPF
jgi:hypothetical protein